MILKHQKLNYAIFGNPICHSKSPIIHNLFAKQIGIEYFYQSICSPVKNFSLSVSHFFKKNGKGANITSPFKLEAYSLSNKLTIRAKIAQSVNTFKKINDRDILGDNTDGIGLLSDLIRLDFIKKNTSVLILGAGGAVRGVLYHLLSFGCSVFILNRTISKAQKLVSEFNQYGKIDVFSIDKINIQKFNLVINAITRNNQEKKNFLPFSCISSDTCFYDMNYDVKYTSFILWCINIGAKRFSDGMGMLIFQAAHSCFLWHKIFPCVNSVINILSKK